MAHNVEEMFSVRVTPWHGLGKIVQEAPDSAAAIKLAGLDWDVISSPVMVNGLTVPNYIANVRSDNQKVLGIVSDRYTIVQNHEAFSFTDKLIGDGNVQYETAGSLREGRLVWMLARLKEDYKILGDDVDPYICFTNTHDGTGSIKVLMTPVRVVCNNTLNLALGSAKRQWSTVHMGNLEQKMKEAEKTLFSAHKYMEELDKEAHGYVDIKINPARWAEVVELIFPATTAMSPRQIDAVRDKRQDLHNAIMAQDIAKFRGTGWAAINAITDYVAHRPPSRFTTTYSENNFANVIHGDKLVDKMGQILKKIA
ncbi:MAG TPA: DUF932 domain-containing protein [Pseudoneobacillus sp.]|nr:DUF932 domain-containing protein [Pseudoneobacillus sp.]